MKSMLKDVILLCKGYYDSEKFPTIFDALKEYYKKSYNTNIDFDDKWLDALLKIVLEQCMSDLGKNYPDRLNDFINNHLIYDNDEYLYSQYISKRYDEVLFYRIISFFSHLKLRGDGLTEINVDDYFSENRDKVTELQLKILTENII